MSVASEVRCELLAWDSEHFGVRIARALGDRLTAASVKDIDEWCRQNQVDCLYFVGDPTDPETIHSAERGGFHLVDIRTTLVRSLSDVSTAADSGPVRTGDDRSPRLATVADMAWVVGLARSSFRDSRFYFDDRFARDRCDLLYEIWTRKSLTDPTQVVWLGQADGQPAGFITCACDPSTQIGSIGLMAVAPPFRGRGVGRDLVACAIAHVGRAGMTRIKVVSQARNLTALRTYEKCGFRTDDMRLTYHKWYPPAAAPS